MIALNPGSFHVARGGADSYFNPNENKSSTAASKLNVIGNNSSSSNGGQQYLFQGLISDGSPLTINSQNNNCIMAAASTSSVEANTNNVGESNYDSYMQIKKQPIGAGAPQNIFFN